jgi:DNA-binding CsgD family transcriptional regulator
VRLDESDLSRVLDVVRVVSEAKERDTFLQSTLEGVAALMPCLVATANEVDPVGGRLTYWMEPASFAVPDDAAELLTELAAEHPLIRHATATGDGSAWRISDFWSQDMFHASRLHRDLYGPMGVEYQMSATLPAAAPVVFGLVVSRADRDFSDRDRDALNVLRPHLAQAWRNFRDQERLRGLVDVANDAVTGRGWNVIVLWDPPDELAPGALVTLYRFFGRPSRTSPLPARVDRWIASQQAHLAEHEELKLIRPLTAQLDGQRIVLRYLPAQGAHPGAIIVDEEPRPARRRDYESLGLSPREAEITELVVLGAGNAAVAAQLHVAQGTVKRHLDNIYAKLGVRSRGQLTAFVLHLVDS